MIDLGSHPVWHPLFETLAYAAGFALYRRARQNSGDHLPEAQRWSVIAAAVLGALGGSRVLGVLEQMPRSGVAGGGHAFWSSLLVPGSGGKTIVGGLLGGWLAVEIVKRVQGIRSRTGDLFAIPLCLGIAVGRVGCLLAGLADDTYGLPTRLPWGVDFGDGIPRHPAQAYEMVFLLGLAAVLGALGRRAHPAQGVLFRVFLAAYLLWRLGIDFLKPQPLVAGMDWIQWACVAGLLALAAGEIPALQGNTDPRLA